MDQTSNKPKLAILVNILAPYRLPLYQIMADTFDVTIFYGGTEENRSSWKDLETKLDSRIKLKRSWGFQVTTKKGKKGNTFDYSFVHINPGYFSDLYSYNPDAIISMEMGFRSLASLIYGKLSNTPVWIYSEVTLYSERSTPLVKKLLRRLIVSLTRYWISFGNEATEYLLSIGIKRNHILQAQNCVNENLFQQPVKAAIDLSVKPVLLYVGQFIGRKGVGKFLDAVAVLEKQGYVFSVLLVGDGPEKEKLVKLSETLELQHVYFYPSQPPEEIPAIYRSGNCLIFPTLEDVWGLVVNEALWSGIPVISSKYAGCAQELLPEENIFDPLDKNSFVNALKRVLEGQISPPDTSPMKLHKDVAQLIIADIQRGLDKN